MPGAPPDRPSKTQRKREMLELQALGESLIDIPDSELARIPLPARLHEAIREARRMSRHGALHRQRQYIGRLMREVDAEPIRAALQRREQQAQRAAERFHAVERWRDRLVAEGDAALAELIEAFPELDRQHLRMLVRNARQPQRAASAPKAARQLFRYLDGLMR